MQQTRQNRLKNSWKIKSFSIPVLHFYTPVTAATVVLRLPRIAELEEINDKFHRRPNPYVGCQAWRAATCALPEPGLRLGLVDSALSRYNMKPDTNLRLGP